jgi:hypothetical protein
VSESLKYENRQLGEQYETLKELIQKLQIRKANLYPESFWPDLSLALEKRLAARTT